MRNFKFLIPCSLIALTLGTLTLSGCWEEQHPGTYYTFTGQTVADDLSRRPEYSDFVKILQRSGMWNNLRIYGNNTCFAPDNNSIADFLREREAFARKQGLDVTYNTVDDLPKEDCDTLAWTHLLDITCYLGDLNPGILPKVNLNDRFLILTLDSTHREQFGDSVVALQRRLNNAIVTLQDDSCENGVVHFIDRCIDFGGDYVYDLVDKDPKTMLFSEALKLCGFHSILNEWYDLTYTIGQDSVIKGITLTQAGNPWHVHYWDKRKTNFTLLVPTDETLSKNGINNVIPDMFNLANSVYNADNELPDSILSDYDNPKNPLFQFLSYHILPFLVDLARINGRPEVMKDHSLFTTTPEDYFETYLPKGLMRITTLINGNNEMDMGMVYINNRGTEGNGTVGFNGSKIKGTRILTAEEMGVEKYSALNGVYHYVDNILLYDTQVREDILDRRLRIDCTTISPDFITSGARQFDNSTTGDNDYSWGFKNPKNFASYHQDYVLQVRPTAKGSSYAYEGDGVDIQGQFDFYVKLPPIPHDGTWQLRLSFRSNSHCGIIQPYLASIPVAQEVQRTDWKPLGIPVDLRVAPTDASVGWKDDDGDELAGDEALINALDKSMKNRGWMKGSAVQTVTGGSKTHRQQNTMARIILMTDYLQSNMDHYLRVKQILDDRNAEFLFDYMEWVPKSVYDGNEDKN
ncbi:MAG: fasciclin domain-containing protein [Bacteroidaceae bacterium]|nr:fasciclin domain-containing protein [Bacteroidaceae bacterium]